MNLLEFKKRISANKTTAKNWPEIIRFREKLEDSKENIIWIYRGQSSNKGLKTSLERTIKDYKLGKEDPFDIEFVLTDRFRRNLTTVDPTVSKDLSPVELFALMQHYGAPTRLVDFTYSFYIALFFALENFQGNSPTIWCIDGLWFQEQTINHLGITEKEFMPGKCGKDFKKYFMKVNGKSVKRAVYQLTPYQLRRWTQLVGQPERQNKL
ncbi:MAG: FRG domain-containing protein [Thermodesulfobacteriota bacterium]|nr:FRG domain-containing protein [Thermodesulfobacteriota bacterium]